MKVNLINYTKNAEDLLIYAKATRLTQGQQTRKKIEKMSAADKLDDLKYIATTVQSSWEFVDYTFEILDVTRAFTHQFVRNRHGSYAQQTMREVEKENFTYLTELEIKENNTAEKFYQDCMENIQCTYNILVKGGIPAEAARGVLPTNIHTNILAKFNLRTLAELAQSRLSLRTQREYRQVLQEMLYCVEKVHPWAVHFLRPDKSQYAHQLGEIINDCVEPKEKRVWAQKLIDQLR